MRPLALTLLTAALLAAAVPARDGADERRPTAGRVTDPERRARLERHLTAFHRLSPEMQARVRKLDAELSAEDTATRARLFGVMERYAGWLARLPEAGRRRVEAAAAGPERLRVVRELLDEQWRDSLPKDVAGDPARVEKWRKEEHERQAARLQSLRAAEEAVLLPALQQQRFREETQKYVKETLGPKLAPQQRKRLENAATRGGHGYFHLVLMLSEAHKLTPPGPAGQWERFREPRPKPAKTPE